MEQKKVNKSAENLFQHSEWSSRTTELGGDEFWPLSGRPYFHVVLAKSQVNPHCQLFVPVKMHSVLPSAAVPVFMTDHGKTWETIYYGNRKHKRFDPRWKMFVNNNDLKLGDACVFELVECSNAKLKFIVQILRGEFPPELLVKVSSETSCSPIEID